MKSKDHFSGIFRRNRKKFSEKVSCALCWGYQEYDHKIRKLYKDKQVDVNNHRGSYMRIQKFLIDKIDGIRLKKGEIVNCTTCEIKK